MSPWKPNTTKEKDVLIDGDGPDPWEPEKEEPTYGGPVTVQPYDALLGEVARAAGHVEWLGKRVAEQHPDMLAAPTSSASRWRDLYEKERKLLVAAADRCVALGLADKQVALAERQGRLVTTLVLRVADQLELSETQRQMIPQMLQSELAALELEHGPLD